jgi:hypothetical protein
MRSQRGWRTCAPEASVTGVTVDSSKS